MLLIAFFSILKAHNITSAFVVDSKLIATFLVFSIIAIILAAAVLIKACVKKGWKWPRGYLGSKATGLITISKPNKESNGTASGTEAARDTPIQVDSPSKVARGNRRSMQGLDEEGDGSAPVRLIAGRIKRASLIERIQLERERARLEDEKEEESASEDQPLIESSSLITEESDSALLQLGELVSLTNCCSSLTCTNVDCSL